MQKSYNKSIINTIGNEGKNLGGWLSGYNQNGSLNARIRILPQESARIRKNPQESARIRKNTGRLISY